MHLAQELVASQQHLASLPNLYYRIRRVIDNPDSSVDDLAEPIASDPTLAAMLLRLANSAFYGFPRKIETLSRAVSLIGLDQLGDIVLASSLAATFQGIRPQRMDMKRFWRGSIRRALLNRLFARHLGERDPERSFVVGLLSDMGHLVMYHAVPDLMGIVLDMCAEDLNSLAANERSIVGCDYCEVGAALSAAWHLPVSMGGIIGAQLTPDMAGDLSQDTAKLNLAISIAEALERGDTITAASPPLFAESPELSGVDLALMPIFAEQCESQLESVMESLGIN